MSTVEELYLLAQIARGLKIANIDRTGPQGARVEGVLVVGVEPGSVAAGDPRPLVEFP